MEKIRKYKIIATIFTIIMSGIIMMSAGEIKMASAESYSSEIVIERLTNRVLYESNAHVKRAMASTTKILTAIAVIENSNLSDVVTIDKSSVGVEGSSIYLREGDKLTVLELLYGLMLRSGNDAATALAKFVGGSIEGFSELMNKTAKQAGASNSNFVNPHGLSAKNHYTTAYDLALISSYALKNQVFSEIVSAKKFTTTYDESNKRIFINKNKMLSNFKGADGIKTGFTKEAGRCLVSSATRNGMQVICVVLNCGPMFERSAQLLEHAFFSFAHKKIVSANEVLGKIEVSGGLLVDSVELEFYCKNDFIYPLTKKEEESIKVTCEIPKCLSFPVKDDEYLGNLNITLGKNLIFSEKLYIINGKDNYTFNEAFSGIIEKWSLNENKQIFG